MKKVFGKNAERLTEEERKSRIDIAYKTTTTGQHIIVELKRPGVSLSTAGLIEQITKYLTAAEKKLQDAKKENQTVEFVCIIGSDLKDWASKTGRKRSQRMLKEINTKVIKYDEVLERSK